MNSLHRPSHAHSSSYPSVFLSGATRSLARAPSRGTKSESGGSIPTSTHSSPLIQSPASSPGRPSEWWKFPSPSRNPSVERISGPLLRSKSTSKGDTSHFLFDRIISPQSWNISPNNDVVQDEQTERYQRTHMRVMRAVGSTSSSLASDMTHEVLVHGTDLLKFAPIPGLEGAARVLLGIWDALQQVETNRLACLRLTERCADILIAIQEEISGLDKRVADTLHEPMERLEDAFQEIKSMMLDKLCQSPFRRYFKRDEVLGEIVVCNTKLQDCLGHFDRSINLRVLEYGLASRNSPSARTDMSFHSTEEIHERIRQIQERQNELDRSRDLVDQPPPSDQEEILEKLGIQKKDIPDAIKTLLRALESLRSTKVFDKVSASLSSRRRSSTWPISHSDENDLRLKDRESIERDIRALKSAYGKPIPTLPSWTITKFEIDLGEIIGKGFFSTVYKGKWGTRVVAVKVLEVHTSKETFVDEVNLWKELDHPNVLQLYGASSIEGNMPWFLVSPLMAHGSIGDYLKRVRWESQRRKESVNKVPDVAHRRVDYLQMMHDIAKGMRYLHDHGVYHGDLKAANVLLAEDLHCVVSDFGLSKWIHQLEEKNFPLNNALRWQAPELMSGGSVPTKKADVYAFAMCCIEILTMGSIPWPTMKDDDVKQHVLYEEGRPPYPEDLVRDLKVENLLHISWHQSPSNRPSFKLLVQKLLVLRDEVMTPDVVLSSPRVVVSAPPELQDQDSSPYHKFVSPVSHEFDDPISLSPRGEYSTPLVATFNKLQSEVPLKDESEEELPLEDSLLLNFDPSPPKPPSTLKKDDMAMKESYDGQFEITYRMCLSHEFPRQLNFPLWTPGDIQLGDIGFLSSSGQFIRLLNSFDPWQSSGNRMNIPGVGNVSIAVRHQKDNLVRKGIKAISKLVSTGESGPNDRIKRRHTFSLSGRRTAFLCAEKTHHRYIQDSRPCKQWFRNYWHAIIHEYGPQHILMKEDLMFIIETLSARNHALFVNHGHLDDKAHFEVFTSPASGESWGTFTLPPDLKHNAPQSFFEKVSVVGSPSQTILIARLRFLTDVEEPTLLNI